MIQLKNKTLIGLLIAALLVGVCMSFGAIKLMPGMELLYGSQLSKYKQTESRYGKLDQLYDVLENNYYKDLDEDSISEGLAKGLFYGTGDPYSSYMTEEEYKRFMETSLGEIEGIGVIFGYKDGGYLINTVVKDGPAEKAGIKAGDVILAVDGKTYKSNEQDQITMAMRGKAGTTVNIKYRRNGKVASVDVRRDKFYLQSVYTGMLEGNIGYIFVSAFEKGTAQEFEKEVRGMELKGAKGLVIDLRGNGGGLVEEAIQLADTLLGEGTLAYIEGKHQERVFLNTQEGKTNLPYVILVDERSASASEIVAAGVKDNGGGKLIGTTTYGKGVIQNMIQLKNGGAIKITTAQYFSPKGNVINEKGVKPDYVVEIPEGGKEDLQMNKALEVLKAEIAKKTKGNGK